MNEGRTERDGDSGRVEMLSSDDGLGSTAGTCTFVVPSES